MPKTPEQTAGELKLYRNQTALMQGLLLQVSRGFVFHFSGHVPAHKALRFAAKMHRQYGALASPQARHARRKRGGELPVSRLFMHPAKEGGYHWWVLAPQPLEGEQMKDAREQRQRLSLGEQYELMRIPRRGLPPTWTWRIRRQAREDWAEGIKRDARREHPAAIQELIARLGKMPMFAGVRRDVFALQRLAAKNWERTHRHKASFVKRLTGWDRQKNLTIPSELPVMRRIASYDEPPMTLGRHVQQEEPA